jgi:F420-0:gamma-glutamyl ligase
MQLVEKIQEVYDFLQSSKELQEIANHTRKDPQREKILIRLANQTTECAHFISTTAKNKGFRM